MGNGHVWRFFVWSSPWMKQKIMVTSSLHEISPDQLGNRVLCWWEGKELLHPPPTLSIQVASGQIFKDDVNGFSSTSDICFMFIIFPEVAKVNRGMISHFPEADNMKRSSKPLALKDCLTRRLLFFQIPSKIGSFRTSRGFNLLRRISNLMFTTKKTIFSFS